MTLAASNRSDLDLWLEKAEAMGELKRITGQVDPDLETAAITYLVGSKASPALLFENIKGHPGHRALYNIIGCNLSRFCMTVGEATVSHPLGAVQMLKQKMHRKQPAKEVTKRSSTRTYSAAMMWTFASFRLSACGRLTAENISAGCMETWLGGGPGQTAPRSRSL